MSICTGDAPLSSPDELAPDVPASSSAGRAAFVLAWIAIGLAIGVFRTVGPFCHETINVCGGFFGHGVLLE